MPLNARVIRPSAKIAPYGSGTGGAQEIRNAIAFLGKHTAKNGTGRITSGPSSCG